MITLLCTGDLHIGRRPTRLSTAEAAGNCSCAAMWDAIVETAIGRQVHAVVLSGDVVDRENRFFEAIGPLERGLNALAQAGIETFAVAGNHDFDVLPRLADTLDAEKFHLLGRDGTWQTAELRSNGQPVVNFLGWSFPQEHVRTDPLDDLPGLPSSEVPTFGIVHGDLDVLQSAYAPLDSRKLQSHPVAAWLLGHVHAPQLVDSAKGAALLYPGSPQSMDPGETGVHGPWLIEIEAGGKPRFAQLPLSRVCYDVLEIDLSDVKEKSAFQRHYIQSLKDRLIALTENAPALEHVVWRVRLIGRTSCHGQLQQFVNEIDTDFSLPIGNAIGTVEKNIIDTRLAIDLEDLARGSDPPGTLARLLLDLDSEPDSGPAQALITQALETIDEAEQSHVYVAVADDAPNKEEARQLLVQQGMNLLDSLIAQREQP